MPTRHTVVPGECISSIAYLYGFFPGTLWDLRENAELRGRRADPNQLVAGDVVVVPEKRPKRETRPTGSSHRFRLKNVPAYLRLQLFLGDAPRRGQPFVIAVDGGIPVDGTTDDEGVLEVAIAPNARSATLTVGAGEDVETYELRLGTLEPAATPEGAAARLRNLGFDPGDGSDDGQALAAALAAFQRRFGLEPTGAADAATTRKLEELHDAVRELPAAPEEPAPDDESGGDEMADAVSEEVAAEADEDASDDVAVG